HRFGHFGHSEGSEIPARALAHLRETRPRGRVFRKGAKFAKILLKAAQVLSGGRNDDQGSHAYSGRDTAALITSRIFASSVGLSIDSVPPAARACSRRVSPKDVIATTGKSASSSFDLTAMIKSKPLTTGIAMSVTITSGRFTCISANASRPFFTAFTLYP